MSRALENRNPERRRASKRAYYERHKERLREKARDSAYAKYHQDDTARRAKYLRLLAKRTIYEHNLRIRRLNFYRLSYLREHGLAAFRSNFIPRLSPAVRAAIPRGQLLEDLDDNALQGLLEGGGELEGQGSDFEGD
ncbi:hypothetical protein EV714DRAFT_277961 [Schizophyllum commune]